MSINVRSSFVLAFLFQQHLHIILPDPCQFTVFQKSVKSSKTSQYEGNARFWSICCFLIHYAAIPFYVWAEVTSIFAMTSAVSSSLRQNLSRIIAVTFQYKLLDPFLVRMLHTLHRNSKLFIFVYINLLMILKASQFTTLYF